MKSLFSGGAGTIIIVAIFIRVIISILKASGKSNGGGRSGTSGATRGTYGQNVDEMVRRFQGIDAGEPQSWQVGTSKPAPRRSPIMPMRNKDKYVDAGVPEASFDVGGGRRKTPTCFDR